MFFCNCFVKRVIFLYKNLIVSMQILYFLYHSSVYLCVCFYVCTSPLRFFVTRCDRLNVEMWMLWYQFGFKNLITVATNLLNCYMVTLQIVIEIYVHFRLSNNQDNLSNNQDNLSISYRSRYIIEFDGDKWKCSMFTSKLMSMHKVARIRCCEFTLYWFVYFN